ncbi:MAG: 3'(2'),5'-bisphosphate nucleotidase CysQ, partial [Cyclobacteriaceae bacterium]|nr:3'(2'),5'-bisphosphate nucleotidase CysQ [Cyclobacteriaceae bacterium]
KDFKKFWLVDPLDGTKEFINRNGDFTVNIALIEGHYPVAGFIYMPVQDVLYVGSEEGAFRYDKEGKTNLQVNGSTSERVAVRSRSHASPEEEEILQKYLVEKEMSRGSSLKFCAVAEGSADLYYRHGPTMEWDTAAGQAILEAAGGRMYIGNKEELRFRYNKENLLNSGFLCLGF